MTLSIGLSAALSSLTATSEHTSVVSRNVANQGNANASRKIANLVTLPGGGVRLASVTRVTNDALFNKLLASTSDLAAQQAVADGLNRLDETVNDPDLERSPAALVSKLADALQRYAAAPSDAIIANSAVSAANDLAAGLNSATQAVQQVRTQADSEMALSVGRVNTLLAQFETVNHEIMKGSAAEADITDYLDQRDDILRSLSEEIGIRTVTRGDNDMAIFTESGVTLFDAKPRPVTFDQSLALAPGSSGNAVFVDGVPITGSSGAMLVSSGRLAGLAKLRDTVTVTYQGQLDEIARGLIEVFAEKDQSVTPTLPDVPGLFTYPGAPAMPPSGTLQVGLAATIKVNANVDPAQGGVASRLRDGGISNPGNPAYVYNPTGAASFTDRLEELGNALNTPRAFDTATQGVGTATVAGFAASSVAWLQEGRKTAGDDVSYKSTLLDRASDSLSRATGVNLDEEMTLLLDLERAYQASTKLMTTIDSMLQTLLGTVR